MPTFPARQVHLDFHTSEHIRGIGQRFSERQFTQALQRGRVNSITVFAKCHHSWSYYPTKIGRQHPHLATDLMGRQIDACHKAGVRVPIYYTVGWSATDAADHPEWRVIGKDGKAATMSFDLAAKPTDAKPNFSWIFLCPSGTYRELMLRQTLEICTEYPVDGLFYDICNTRACYCPNCRAGMKAEGVKVSDDQAVWDYAVRKWVSFMQACREIVLTHHRDATVFFNGQAHEDTPRSILDCQTHYELEDLPTVWGGYDKFPPRAKFFERDGKAILAMSGKFHTAWGEFGGFKHPDAIRFEAASMIAYGAACSFGDQLHPNGVMDMSTYGNIGQAYEYVEQIEPYGLPSRTCASLGLVLSHDQPHDQGVANMLMEGHYEFDIAHPAADWSRFETLILAGTPFLDRKLARQLQAFIKAGGKVLALGRAALIKGTRTLAVDIGARYRGPASYELDYAVAGPQLAADLPATPFLCYTAAIRVTPAGGKVLAKIHEPFFNRTYGKYCSHQNTPYRDAPAAHPAALEKGRVLFLAHELGAMYHAHGARVHRDLFLNALARVHANPTVRAALPSAGRVSLRHQPDHRRYALHLLYAAPMQRGKTLIIEDLPTLRDIPVTLRLPEKIKRATLPLRGQTLRTRRGKAGLHLTVPELTAHEVVLLEY